VVHWDRGVDNVKKIILKEIIAYTRGAQHAYTKKEIIVLLKAHQDVGQPLYTIIVQVMIKTFIQKRELNLFNYNNNSGFIISPPWGQNFVNQLELDFQKNH
jgi:hypothetical protein